MHAACNPPPQAAQFELRNGRTTIFATSPSLDIFPIYAWGEPELFGSQGPVASFPLRIGNGYPISDRFVAPSATFDLPAEVELFARDPEETSQALTGLLDPHAVLDQLWTPDLPSSSGEVVHPAALAQFYPQFENQPSTTALPSIPPSLFFGTLGQPGGPGANPAGFGSVKALRMTRAGACTYHVDYTRELARIQALLHGRLASCEGKAQIIDVHNVTATSTLRHDTGRFFDSRGGFFLNVEAFTLRDGVIGTCTVRASQAYEWGLEEGLLRLQPDGPPLVKGSGGGACGDKTIAIPPVFITIPGAESVIGDQLYNVVPNEVRSEVEPQQWVDPLGRARQIEDEQQRLLATAALSLWGGCDLYAQPSPSGAPADPCIRTRLHMRDVVVDDVNANRISAADGARLVATINELSQDGTRFRNFRCRAFGLDPGPIGGPPKVETRCEFPLRARRLVPHPDAVDVVLYDRPDELSSTTRALELYLGHFGNAGATLHASACTYSAPYTGAAGTGVHPTYLARPFAVLRDGDFGCFSDYLCAAGIRPKSCCADLHAYEQCRGVVQP